MRRVAAANSIGLANKAMHSTWFMAENKERGPCHSKSACHGLGGNRSGNHQRRDGLSQLAQLSPAGGGGKAFLLSCHVEAAEYWTRRGKKGLLISGPNDSRLSPLGKEGVLHYY